MKMPDPLSRKGSGVVPTYKEGKDMTSVTDQPVTTNYLGKTGTRTERACSAFWMIVGFTEVARQDADDPTGAPGFISELLAEIEQS